MGMYISICFYIVYACQAFGPQPSQKAFLLEPLSLEGTLERGLWLQVCTVRHVAFHASWGVHFLDVLLLKSYDVWFHITVPHF